MKITSLSAEENYSILLLEYYSDPPIIYLTYHEIFVFNYREYTL